MAAAAMARPGVISWALAIRTTMANDPGRQYLEDQIQSNGFLFLNDYLDNILTGPKQEPIIELVKTPGRKKDVPRRTRAATAAAAQMKAMTSILFEGNDHGKENVAPNANSRAKPILSNKLHKAFMHSKENVTHIESDNQDVQMFTAGKLDGGIGVSPSQHKQKGKQKSVVIADDVKKDVHMIELGDEEEERAVEDLVTPPHTKHATTSAPNIDPLPAAAFLQPLQTPALANSETRNDLSVIAEDDEYPESNSNATQPSRTATSSKEVYTVANGPVMAMPSPMETDARTQSHIPVQSGGDATDLTQTSNFTASTSTSTHTFHTITLESPVLDTVRSPDEISNAHFPQSATSATLQTRNDFTPAPLPSMTEHAIRIPSESSSPKGMSRKASVPHFPTIGAPSPVRKSMRITREPSLAAAVTSTALTNTTRSSWLVKAREAKAMEENTRKFSTVAPGHASAAVSGVKRKSAEMLGMAGGELVQENDQKGKVAKISEDTVTSLAMVFQEKTAAPSQAPPSSAKALANAVQQTVEQETVVIGEASEGMMDRLKKTVEGFSARMGKSMGKSLGGAAATALAEAKAAAEAKIAERNAAEGRLQIITSATVQDPTPPAPVNAIELPRVSERLSAAHMSEDAERRLSVSDLVTVYEAKRKSKEPERVFQPPPPQPTHAPGAEKYTAGDSTSTTPPNSPHPTRPIFSVPQGFKLYAPPSVFQPPPFQPVFANDPVFKPPVFSARERALPSSQSTFVSTQSSTYSDHIFSSQSSAWLPHTQDTEYTDIGDSQPLYEKVIYTGSQPDANMEADDESWHMDDQFAENPLWAGMAEKDEDITWSTDPTRSQKGETESLQIQTQNSSQHLPQEKNDLQTLHAAHGAFHPKRGSSEVDMDVDERHIVIDEVPLESVQLQSTVSLVEHQSTNSHTRTNSQTSVPTSQTGFLGTASKLVSSVLGGSRKGKAEPVKSLQLAAAAAIKQQEEKEKKAARLKEMEVRRQQALQKKNEGERAREEKKIKDENERRKREKEEHTEKRPKVSAKKVTQVDEDLTKKRKIVAESEKKPDTKKPPSKDKRDLGHSRIGKPGFNNSQTAAGNSSVLTKSLKQTNAPPSASSSSSTVKLVSAIAETKTTTLATSIPSVKGKGKENANESSISGKQPSQVMHAQMQARVDAQLEEARKLEQPAVPSESIELPDINSEYSDSEDEDRVRTFDPPEWAQSPELREALQTQSTVNPDDIFGAIRPLRMEELFKTRTSRFRARTSSANWAGTDMLTVDEERDYVRRMGYKN